MARRILSLKTQGWLFAAGLALGVTVARLPAATAADDDVQTLRGRSVYERACVACHGILGNGKGPAARYLEPHPRDFTLGQYKFRSTPTGMPPTDDDLYRTVSSGVPTTTMPAFGAVLSERERRDVVAYIKTFSKNFDSMPSPKPIEIPDPTEQTPKSIEQGSTIYILSGCWTCHGPQGRGDGEASAALIDVSGNRIRPVDFTRGRFKGGDDDRSIYRTLHTGLNGTPMPSYSAALLFAGDGVTLPSTIGDTYGKEEIARVKEYLAAQPSGADLAAMSTADKTALGNERAWALVYYLKSLSKEPSIWYRLFAEDTEVTQ